MGYKDNGDCIQTDDLKLVCTLNPDTLAYWIRSNRVFFLVVVLTTLMLVASAHTMSFLQHKKHFSAGYYLALLVVFTLCITYITLFICADYTVSDPKVLIQCGLATSMSSIAFTWLLHREQELPDFKNLAAIFFGVPIFNIVLFTWIFQWHNFGTNGMMSIWQLIFGIFIWFETDFAKEHKLRVRDNFLSIVFVYFEFLLFLYCLCS